MTSESIRSENNQMVLDHGSRLAVIGGGPAGSFFSYFILQMASRMGLRLSVDIYERRDFGQLGPVGCNMCGGVLNESLMQALSVEGIELPPDVVQRGIDSFFFHTDRETVALYAPFRQMRIATVYRGSGPKGATGINFQSFDGYLLGLASNLGARTVHERVIGINRDENGKVRIHTKDGQSGPYDLVAGAIGVNTPTLEIFEKLGIGYRQPTTRKTSNLEFRLGSQFIHDQLGNSMHAFLLKLPKLDFAALIPKGDYVTMCLIGDNINSQFVEGFIDNPIVKTYLGDGQGPGTAACRCAPLASLGNAKHPYGDRVVILGDSGMARLNKDGIGSAYRVAKTAAATALFSGVSSKDFAEGYWPVCRSIASDNRYGRLIFRLVDIIKKVPLLTKAVMRMARKEQAKAGGRRRMSMVLWDMFTGSSPYREVFIRSLHPAFLIGFLWNVGLSVFSGARSAEPGVQRGEEENGDTMNMQSLGRDYKTGEYIVKEGEIGDCMCIILSGQAEVMRSNGDEDVRLAVIGKGDIVGEMAIFQKERRSASVRALTDMKVMQVDRKIFLKRMHEDPSFVFAILQRMSQRIRDLNAEIIRRN